MSQKPFTRSVTRQGEGSLGISLPRDILRQHGIEKGDEVPIEYDEQDGAVAVRLE